MGVAWLLPGAWWLAALVAVPVTVHLLARQRRHPLRFPTLRFLEAASAPSRRHWRVRDPALLALRGAIILALAAALAGPMLVTAARQARWDARLARAVVIAPAVVEAPAVTAEELREPEGASRRFVTADFAAGLADAAAWLQSQGVSRREVVVVAPLARGALTNADVRALPAGVGVRFVRAGAPAASTREHMAARLEGDSLWRVRASVTQDDTSTTVREVERAREAGSVVELTGSDAERPAAEAARRAVLRRGVALTSANDAPVSVPWTGSVAALAAAVDARSAPHEASGLGDHIAIDDATLAAWTRAAVPRGQAAPVDDSDRRAVWLAVLALLGLEWWWRRRLA